MTPEEIKQVVEDYRKSSQSLNEFIEIDFKKLRNLRVKDSDKVNGDKDKKNGNGAQGATNGAQGAQSSTTTGAQGAQSNDSVGAQGAQSSTTTGAQGAQSNDNVGAQGNGAQSSTTGAQGAQSSTTTGAQGAQTNTIKKNEIDQFIRQGKEVTINDFGGIKPSNPSGKVIPKPTKPLMTNSPAAKAGIPLDTRQKFANQNAAFQATKNKDSGYTKMDFIKDFPDSQTAKKYNKGEKIPGFSYKKNLNNSYEPYDLVLDYVLTEGHADSVEEAHYVMMQMDEGTIQTIVEFLGGRPGDGYLGHPNLDIKNPFFRGKRTKGPVLNKSNADKLPDVNVNKVGATIGDRNMKLKKMIDDI
tara:strand:- start:108 stop:1175 length:1068 start_codon:yes stop_codon:yes gene_type:complete